MKLVFAAVASLVATSAMAAPANPNQFSIKCADTKEVMSFDLTTKRWCYQTGVCKVNEIIRVTPTRIVLTEKRSDIMEMAGMEATLTIYLDRTTGAYHARHDFTNGRVIEADPVACERRPYVPIPARKF